MNLYRLTDIETGEVIEGTSREMEMKGFDSTAMSDYACRNTIMQGRYRVQIIKDGAPSKKERRQFQKKNIESLEDVNEKARELGMTYGEYMAWTYLQMQRRERKQTL